MVIKIKFQLWFHNLLEVHMLEPRSLRSSLILLFTATFLHPLFHRELKHTLIELIDLVLEELDLFGAVVILLLQHLQLGILLFTVLLCQCRAQLMYLLQHGVLRHQLFDLPIHLRHLLLLHPQLLLQPCNFVTFRLIPTNPYLTLGLHCPGHSHLLWLRACISSRLH